MDNSKTAELGNVKKMLFGRYTCQACWVYQLDIKYEAGIIMRPSLSNEAVMSSTEYKFT